VDNNYLDLGMNKSGFVHTLPSGRLTSPAAKRRGRILVEVWRMRRQGGERPV
jgi:hypothetical protein